MKHFLPLSILLISTLSPVIGHSSEFVAENEVLEKKCYKYYGTIFQARQCSKAKAKKHCEELNLEVKYIDTDAYQYGWNASSTTQFYCI